jgi:adenine deaminase
MVKKIISDLLAADLVIINGKIVTVDKKFSIVQAVATKDGKIIAVGKNEDIKELAGKNTKVLDLKGKTVLPGINDSRRLVKRSRHFNPANGFRDGDGTKVIYRNA